MTTSSKPDTVPLHDAFYELALVRPIPTAATIDDLVRRYPEHASALTEYAIELAIDALKPDGDLEAAEAAIDINETSPAVSRAMSRFQNKLHALTADAAALRASNRSTTISNPIARLDRSAFRSFVRGLDVTPVFALKLRDRVINQATMTQGFQQRVAQELSVPVEQVVAHFAASPALNAELRLYKADEKPTAVALQTFEEAVLDSALSDEQQRRLRKL